MKHQIKHQPFPDGKTRIIHLRDKGFALISSIMIMTLLTMIAFSMLSFSAITTRTSKFTNPYVAAQANARIALMTAIAQLQETMGPDQRVSINASILDSNIDTLEIDNVNQPQWAGASDTRIDDQEMIYRDDLLGGLFDRRTNLAWDSTDWKKSRVSQWLVSGSGRENLSPIDFDSSLNAVQLTSTMNGTRKPVFVPEVTLPDGGYAYWVSDENQKIRLNLKEVTNDQLALNGLTRPTEALIETSLDFVEQDKPKAISLDMLDLVDGNSANFDRYLYDVSSDSQSILADTLRGNLKQDLSVFLEKGDQPNLTESSKILSFGLKTSDRMAGFRNEEEATYYGKNWNSESKHKLQSPRWGLLKSWTDYAKQHSGSSSSSIPIQIANRFQEYDDDRVLKQQAALDDQSKVEIRPILVESSIYTNLTSRISGGKRVLRLHIYPRVVLWNPYNVTIKAAPYLVHNRMIGDQNMTIRMADATTKDCTFHLPKFDTVLTPTGDARKGCLIFSLAPVDLEPGECLVFSPAAGNSTPFNVAQPTRNVLTATKSPGTDNFYLDNAVYSDGALSTFDSSPRQFKFNSSSSQDYMTILLGYPNNSYNAGASYSNMRESFNALQVVQASYKAGAYGNAHGRWNSAVEPPIEPTATGYNAKPNYKTREGYRLRWFDEHGSNKALASPSRNLQVSHIANGNIRAQLHMRTPHSLLTWTEPELFGNYTRDMWNVDVGWDNMEPIPLDGGKFGGNPFAAPQDWAAERYILFELPKEDVPLISIAKFQHTPISAFGWHPTYVIGNSFPDPRAQLKQSSHKYTARGGWTQNLQNSYIQALFQRWIQRDPRSKSTEIDQLMYDCSYEINYGIWDRYFLSGAKETEKNQAADNNSTHISNEHLTLLNAGNKNQLKESLIDFHKAAYSLAKDGGFNVNSTSVIAWKALLASNRGRKIAGTENSGETPFARILTAKEKANSSASDDDDTWNGFRSLTDEQLDTLAREIVKQVKLRGPFVSVSDFVNRRLSDDPRVRYGVLQQAIENAGLNDNFNDYAIDQTKINTGGQIRGTLDQTLKAKHSAAGAPGYLMQADILQTLSPSLFARSDTFKIRAYGCAKDSSGKILAKAYCEVIVQRSTQPIQPDSSGINPIKDDEWGRKFNIIRFRWMNENEL